RTEQSRRTRSPTSAQLRRSTPADSAETTSSAPPTCVARRRIRSIVSGTSCIRPFIAPGLNSTRCSTTSSRSTCTRTPSARARGVEEARHLIAEHGVRGFKFHPTMQAFFPNDRAVYPLYEAIAEAGLPALFHSGHTGIGAGLPGGGGVRLKYSNPMFVDDVAV